MSNARSGTKKLVWICGSQTTAKLHNREREGCYLFFFRSNASFDLNESKWRSCAELFFTCNLIPQVKGKTTCHCELLKWHIGRKTINNILFTDFIVRVKGGEERVYLFLIVHAHYVFQCCEAAKEKIEIFFLRPGNNRQLERNSAFYSQSHEYIISHIDRLPPLCRLSG